MKIQGLLLLLLRLSLVAIDDSLQRESASLVASAWSSRWMTSLTHSRHLSIANPHSDDDTTTSTTTKDESSSSSKTKEVNPYAMKTDSSDSETTTSGSTASTSTTSTSAQKASPPASTSSTATGKASKTNATTTPAAEKNSTATTNSTKSENSTDTNDDDSLDDDAGPVSSLSQWNISDLTLAPTNETGLLPPEGEPPEIWPIMVGSIFVLTAVVLCAMTGVRVYRNRRKRQDYEEVQTVIV